MSISTRTGDDGTTGLMYGRRVPKHHLRVETYGTVDELNTAIGWARAVSRLPLVQTELLQVQKTLVPLMGELAVGTEDQQRYSQDKYPKFDAQALARLDDLVQKLEAQKITFAGWATPGADVPSAALDVARTTCRRAERRVSELHTHEPVSDGILRYLNRLSDVLWLMARLTETELE